MIVRAQDRESAGMTVGAILLGRAIAVARHVRAELLGRSPIKLRRDLAGHCGLAAMRVASLLQEPGVLRVGFYMRHETFCGRRGRYPNSHAWCQIDGTIVDPTAKQFGGRHRAVHVVTAAEDDRYIESESGIDAVDTILIDWHCGNLPEYKRLAKALRTKDATKWG